MNGLKFVSSCLLGFSLVFSCKTGSKTNKDSELEGLSGSGKQSTGVCYTGRSIRNSKEQLDFNSRIITPFTAYWLGIMSSLAYESPDKIEQKTTNLFADDLIDFHFYDPNKDLGGVSAESFYVHSKQGWILSFRGTDGLSDWVTNFRRSTFKFKGIVPERGKKARFEELQLHTGFYETSSKVFDLFVKTYVQNSKDIKLDQGSEEAFNRIDLIISGIASEADVYEQFDPDKTFMASISNLKDLGILRSNANDQELLGVASIWGEEMANIGNALAMANGDRLNPSVRKVVEKSILRKKNAAKRVHDFINFKKFEPLWITGHSYGGAMAVMISYRLLKFGIPFQGLVTFGGPKVGNVAFKNYYEGILETQEKSMAFARFHAYQDIVPLVPKIDNNWGNILKPWYLSAKDGLFIPKPFDTALPQDAKNFGDSWNGNNAKAAVNFYEFESTDLPDTRSILTADILFQHHDIDKVYLQRIENYAFGSNLSCSQ